MVHVGKMWHLSNTAVRHELNMISNLKLNVKPKSDTALEHSYSRRRKRERKYIENQKILISFARKGTVTEK